MDDIFDIIKMTEEIKDKILSGDLTYRGVKLPSVDGNMSKKKQHAKAREHGRQIAEIIKKYNL